MSRRRTVVDPAPGAASGRRRRVQVTVAVAAAVGALAALGTAAAVGRGSDPLRASGPVTPGTPSTVASPAGPSPSSAAATSTPATRSTPSAPATPVQAWREGVGRDYTPLAQSAFSAVRTITEWNVRRATADDVAARIQLALVSGQDTQRALAARQALPGTRQALLQYREAADLYLQSLQTVLVATSLPDGDLQQQLRRSGARSRDLGDRLFDLAGSSLAPLLPPEPGFEGVELRKPPEVPDYSAIELGVGPPLEPEEQVGGEVRTFQDVRPEQPPAAWAKVVRDLELPDAQRVSDLLSGTDSTAQAAAARGLVTAAERLYEEPDPRGRRGDSTQVQLALLVHAESLRVAQAGLLVPPTSRSVLRSVAEGLAASAVVLRQAGPA